MMPKMGGYLAAIRDRNRTPPDGDRSPMIFPRFGEHHGHPMCLENGPFCELFTDEDWRNYGSKHGLWRTAEMMPKMGVT